MKRWGVILCAIVAVICSVSIPFLLDLFRAKGIPEWLVWVVVCVFDLCVIFLCYTALKEQIIDPQENETQENERYLNASVEVPRWVRYGHTRKPNEIVLGLYVVFDWIADFGPMFSSLFRFIKKTVVGTWDLLVRLFMVWVNVAILAGILYVSVGHSYHFLTYYAGMSGIAAMVFVAVWETVFVYCSLVIDFKYRNEKKTKWWDWAGFIMGWLFVEVSNYMGMAPNWYGKAIGLATPLLLLVMKKVLQYQFKDEEQQQKKESWLSKLLSFFKGETSNTNNHNNAVHTNNNETNNSNNDLRQQHNNETNNHDNNNQQQHDDIVGNDNNTENTDNNNDRANDDNNKADRNGDNQQHQQQQGGNLAETGDDPLNDNTNTTDNNNDDQQQHDNNGEETNNDNTNKENRDDNNLQQQHHDNNDNTTTTETNNNTEKHNTNNTNDNNKAKTNNNKRAKVVDMSERRKTRKELDHDTVIAIYLAKGSNAEIGRQFGVSAEAVRKIKNGERHAEITAPYRQAK